MCKHQAGPIADQYKQLLAASVPTPVTTRWMMSGWFMEKLLVSRWSVRGCQLWLLVEPWKPVGDLVGHPVFQSPSR